MRPGGGRLGSLARALFAAGILDAVAACVLDVPVLVEPVVRCRMSATVCSKWSGNSHADDTYRIDLEGCWDLEL